MNSFIDKLDHKMWSEKTLGKASGILNVVPIFWVFGEPWKALLRAPRKELIARFFYNAMVYSIPFVASIWALVATFMVTDKTGAIYGLMAGGFFLLLIGLTGYKEVVKLGFYIFISKKNIAEVLESKQTFKGLRQPAR